MDLDFFVNELKSNEVKKETFKTNVKELDKLFKDGISFGKILEVSGEPDCGKTTLMLDILEKLDGEKIALYVSTSVKTLQHFKYRGLGEKENVILLISNKDYEIFNYLKESIKNFDLVIIDSVAEIVTSNESEEFDLDVNQDFPSIIKDIYATMYGEESVCIIVNYLIYKNRELVSRWDNLFKIYCDYRVRVVEYNNEEKVLRKIE